MDLNLKIANITDQYSRLYEANKETIFSGSSTFVNKKREKAIKAFQQLSFPGKKSEDYKYTNLEKLFEKDLKHVFNPEKIDFELQDIFSCDIPELDTHVVLVLNGFYYSTSELLEKLDNGIIFGSLQEASKKYPEIFEKHFEKYAHSDKEAITALNTAFARDGVFLYVPKNEKLDKPIQIIHLLLSDQDQIVQHRNLFILEENSEAEVLICDHTLSTQEFLTNSVTEMYAGPNAILDLTRVQNEHNGSIQLTNSFIHQEKDSRVNTNYITLHGGVVRNNLQVYMNDEGCENNALGLFLCDKDQHVDNFVYINHLKPNCVSNQLYKGILDDNATGAFNGKIHVWPDAQKTQAYQKNNNILLSDNAKMNSKPQLEIYADDVKCSHGSTMGQLDDEALFYLRSRGIPEKESRHLLLYAFVHEVFAKIKLPALKERIDELVSKRLRGELSRCNNCKMNCR
jgi:Fe-S cluster assembly protein SufD